MQYLEAIQHAIEAFSGMSASDFALSEHAWTVKSYARNEIFNPMGNVCTNMGFIIEGTFRSYLVDADSGNETNVFLYSTNGFVVTYKSFINQMPCDYHTQALTDATIVAMSYRALMQLFAESKAWEKFGRLLAQEAFNITMTRVEGFLYKTPQQRYLDLIADHPDIFNNIPLYHLSSYLGIRGPSLSRIRRRMLEG